jgi:hypothetical protein
MYVLHQDGHCVRSDNVVDSSITWRAVAITRLRLTRLDTDAQSSGARPRMLHPCNHGSSQNKIELSSSTLHEKEALKKAEVAASSATGREAQGRVGSVLRNHSHRARRAMPMRLRFLIPSPLNSRSLCTRFQPTRHLPPCTMSLADHRKACMIFVRALITHLGTPRLIAK